MIKLFYVISNLLLLISPCFGEINHLYFSPKRSIAADFPCKPEVRNAKNSAVSVNALECLVSDENNLCRFIITDSNMDMEMYSKHGVKWIDAIHDAYAKQLGLFKTILYKKTKTTLGDSIDYEIYVKNQGLDMQIKGTWVVDGDRLVRISTICAPLGTNFLKSQRNNFLSTLTIIK